MKEKINLYIKREIRVIYDLIKDFLIVSGLIFWILIILLKIKNWGLLVDDIKVQNVKEV